MNEEAAIQTLRSDLALHVSRAAGRLGGTQTVAAQRLGIPQSTMSKIINGRVANLSIELLLRIAVRAGVAITLQIGRNPEEAGAFVSGLARRDAQTPASKLAREARHSLRESERILTPEERLEAFLEHNQLLSVLHLAGRAVERQRSSARTSAP